MALSWNDIRTRAAAFARDWENETRENAEAQTFWNEFLAVFGVDRKRVKAVFEKAVKNKLGGASGRGRIDLLWPGRLLAEHKTRGKDLDAAYTQATDYFAGLEEHERPPYVVVSDFARIRLYTVETGEHIEFPISDFPQHVEQFAFIAGFQQRHFREQDPVNVKAAEQMARLHDLLEASGYTGHQLELLLVRLLFLLFADDTGLFDQKGLFYDLLHDGTRKDGTDTGQVLARLFQVLDTPLDKRQSTLSEKFTAFPYVNGALFRERLDLADFDDRMRELLMGASALDWGKISPAIFGSMFQGVMDKAQRRALGAHYTSEANILKVLGPLFLDGLRTERDEARGSRVKLQRLLALLPTLRFLDPACGSGNFLILAYRELRRLELDILLELSKGQQFLEVVSPQVNVGQFYGIEFEEFPAQIARVAMWLTDHQMNVEASYQLGDPIVSLPLANAAHILHGDALETDWEAQLGLPGDAVSLRRVYIVGNPPFIGGKVMSAGQRDQIKRLFEGVKDAGVLDYVAGWYLKAAQAMNRWHKAHPHLILGTALVSTNSITQGEQVAPLWGTVLNDYGLHLTFAHRTFKWSNEAKGKAAVHCVVVGFSPQPVPKPRLFDYAKPDGPALEVPATRLNPYLVDGPTVLVRKAQAPLRPGVPPIHFGNTPLDGGHLLLTTAERDELLKDEPGAAKFIKPLLDAQDFLNGGTRYCLWLKDAEPGELRKLPRVMERVEKVRQWRLASTREQTRKKASTPTLFGEDRHPSGSYVVVPKVSSERREYVPVGFMTSDTVVNDLLFMVPDADLFHFGLLMSKMHMAWLRYVGGRLESRYRYSKDLVYNTFPWPDRAALKPTQVQAVEAAAQQVLAVREKYPTSTLADLYDPAVMPPDLRQAHDALDRAVEACYRRAAFKTEAERVAYLLDEYLNLAPELLAAAVTAKGRGRKAKAT